MLDCHPRARPRVRPAVPPSLHPSIRPSVHPSVRPSIRPSMRPSIHLSIHPSAYLFWADGAQPSQSHIVRSFRKLRISKLIISETFSMVGEFPMDLGSSLLKFKNMLKSNPLKSRFLVSRPTVPVRVCVCVWKDTPPKKEDSRADRLWKHQIGGEGSPK